MAGGEERSGVRGGLGVFLEAGGGAVVGGAGEVSLGVRVVEEEGEREGEVALA